MLKNNNITNSNFMIEVSYLQKIGKVISKYEKKLFLSRNDYEKFEDAILAVFMIESYSFNYCRQLRLDKHYEKYKEYLSAMEMHLNTLYHILYLFINGHSAFKQSDVESFLVKYSDAIFNNFVSIIKNKTKLEFEEYAKKLLS